MDKATEAEKRVYDYLVSQRMNEALNGFHYLNDVIVCQIHNPNYSLRQLHAVVATDCEVSIENVSMSIRYCLRDGGVKQSEKAYVRHVAQFVRRGDGK